MVALVQRINTGIDRNRRLRKALVENPVFGVTDAFSNWVCPYCQKIQRHIQIYDAAQESSVFDKTVGQVVDHLYANCDAFQEGQAPRARRAGPRRHARLHVTRHPARIAQPIPGRAFASQPRASALRFASDAARSRSDTDFPGPTAFAWPPARLFL